MIKIVKNKQGFTLVEFLLAVGMFSFFIVFVLVGFVQINRSYSRGITVKQVQQSARTVLEDISRSLQSVNQAPQAVVQPSLLPGEGYRYCLEDIGVKYSWNQFNSMVGAGGGFTEESYTNDTDNIFSLVKSDIGDDSCTTGIDSTGSNSEELISNNLKIQSLEIEGLVRHPSEAYDSSFKAFKVRLLLAVDDEDLVEQIVDAGGITAQCNSDPGSAQFCDVVEYSTIVTLRN